MIFNRYAGDYRLENQTDASGRLKTVAVYRGREYYLALSAGELRTFCRKWLLWLLPIAALFVPGFFLNGAGGRRPYVTLPYIALLLPLYLSAAMLPLLRRERTCFERKDRDRIERRSRGCPLLIALLALISGIGRIAVCWMEGHWSAPDMVCATAMLLTAFCGAKLFALGRQLRFN